MRIVRMMLSCCVLVVSTQLAVAQMAMGDMKKTGPAAGTIVSPAKAVDAQLSIIEEEMMGAAKAMPAEKYDFAPTAAIFVPGQTTDFGKVRTFAQQAAHVAQANYFFYMTLSGLKPDADVRGIGKLKTKDEILAALAGSFAFAHKAIATLTVQNAFEVVKIDEPGIQTKSTLATFGVSHAFDHYGQMAEYLRMNGIVPPASAPTK